VEIEGVASATVVVALAVLLSGFGSAVSLAAEAEFVNDPAPPTVTTIATVASAPLAIEPSGHVTTPELSAHVPCDGVADTNETPSGSVSETRTFAAVSGPLPRAVSV